MISSGPGHVVGICDARRTSFAHDALGRMDHRLRPSFDALAT